MVAVGLFDGEQRAAAPLRRPIVLRCNPDAAFVPCKTKVLISDEPALLLWCVPAGAGPDVDLKMCETPTAFLWGCERDGRSFNASEMSHMTGATPPFPPHLVLPPRCATGSTR